MSNRKLTYLAMALAGGAVGAAVALLTVPSAGSDTRRRLSGWMDEETGRAARAGRNALDSARIYYNEGADFFADVVNG